MLKNKKPLSRQKLSIFAMLVLAFAVIAPALSPAGVQAGQITNRSLTLIAGASDGGSAPGGTANHRFEFDLVGGTSVGSMKFQYCTTAAPVPDGIDCDAPDGVDVLGADLTTEDGVTGFSFNQGFSTANEVVLVRGSATSTSAGTVTIQLDNIVNPTNPNETFFVRITTHQSTDGTGPELDFGTVTAATAEPIILTGTMPESLVFCTGASIGLTGGVPDCTTATSGSIGFDRLFSPADTATARSQMSASTNAGFGYAITVHGSTLSSGSNEIDPMSNGANGPTGIILGTSQFGLNLVENTVTNINSDPLGLDVAPVPNEVNYRGIPNVNYNVADLFKFATGDVLAESNDGGPGGTDAQIFTASYIVNVPGSQPAGTYSTTLTYICTATF